MVLAVLATLSNYDADGQRVLNFLIEARRQGYRLVTAGDIYRALNDTADAPPHLDEIHYELMDKLLEQEQYGEEEQCLSTPNKLLI